jgi:hypothetical protein
MKFIILFPHSASRWNLTLSYNVHRDTQNTSCNNPSVDDQALFFYARLPETFFSLLGTGRFGNPPNYTITSRQLVTNSLDPSNVKWDQGTENILRCEPPDISTTIVAEVATESESTTSPVVITTVPEMITTDPTTGEPTEGVFSSTTIPETEKMTGGTTDLTDVIKTTVPEMTTTVTTTTEVFPITDVLEGIKLAVCDGGECLSSQLQSLILVYVHHKHVH